MNDALTLLICQLFGHQYTMFRRVIPGIREVCCVRCAKLFAVNDSLETVLPLDNELRQMHDELIVLRKERIALTKSMEDIQDK